MLTRPPILQGIIRRRILVNYRLEPRYIEPLLPEPFRTKTVGGYAIAGICLIRLEQMRPKALSLPLGASSENAAHRIAVCWTDESEAEREGVYIPRRDTDALLQLLVGGRLFPGEHHRARFAVEHEGDRIDLRMESADGAVRVEVSGRVAERLEPGSVFGSVDEASAFFERGSVGWSATREAGRLDGLELYTRSWSVRPLTVSHVYSSFFADESRFPPGAVSFDSALLMENIPHEWRPPEPMTCGG